MRAAYATATKPDEPLAALTVGDLPEPSPPEGWTTVDVRASSLNHHDIWSLRGVGLPADRLPMILGCDASGVDADGNEVVVYPVIDDPQDPRRFSLLSERWPGTLAERVAVPTGNLVPKPAGISFLEAACLPTAWLTAYHMLMSRGRVADAESVLVQGAGGGVSTAAVVLAVALGKRVYATSRDADKRAKVAELGAVAIEPGGRLPERVGVVIESVGAPTFEHSLKCSAPGARIVVCGATGGPFPKVDLRRVFMMQLEILGSTMGTAAELAALLDLCVDRDIRPVIDSTYGFSAVADAFARLNSGEAFGKVAIDHLH
ncbi:zinc-binding dehydrogenase [Amorphoplanes digitatis]|uniref:NADPH:quinone reductase-like Zn-dependent oxidoreductase n=1 Tax=Actinoplanes digitatis TaxID=1868 RepID=A0A7W7HSM1_9ACTN|nr:zinc-binding dehydrogenase [Actinoplanes digitatis]MBB4760066.1 NADPH:quinone reductase-like Zn-dependent oxidoreductase [Actinoplanes digitatis]BFE68094.1 zinc-binding dehydrogenase [Actinoplanes digitatis]GID95914.1 Zn-dependent oxidoreductase [Actinoplanes digitatis]